MPLSSTNSHVVLKKSRVTSSSSETMSLSFSNLALVLSYNVADIWVQRLDIDDPR